MANETDNMRRLVDFANSQPDLPTPYQTQSSVSQVSYQMATTPGIAPGTSMHRSNVSNNISSDPSVMVPPPTNNRMEHVQLHPATYNIGHISRSTGALNVRHLGGDPDASITQNRLYETHRLLDDADGQIYRQIRHHLGPHWKWDLIFSSSDLKKMVKQSKAKLEDAGQRVLYVFIRNLPDTCSSFNEELFVVVEKRAIIIKEITLVERDQKGRVTGSHREVGRRLGESRGTDNWTAIYNSEQTVQNPETGCVIFKAFCTIWTRKIKVNSKWHFEASVRMEIHGVEFLRTDCEVLEISDRDPSWKRIVKALQTRMAFIEAKKSGAHPLLDQQAGQHYGPPPSQRFPVDAGHVQSMRARSQDAPARQSGPQKIQHPAQSPPMQHHGPTKQSVSNPAQLQVQRQPSQDPRTAIEQVLPQSILGQNSQVVGGINSLDNHTYPTASDCHVKEYKSPYLGAGLSVAAPNHDSRSSLAPFEQHSVPHLNGIGITTIFPPSSNTPRDPRQSHSPLPETTQSEPPQAAAQINGFHPNKRQLINHQSPPPAQGRAGSHQHRETSATPSDPPHIAAAPAPKAARKRKTTADGSDNMSGPPKPAKSPKPRGRPKSTAKTAVKPAAKSGANPTAVSDGVMAPTYANGMSTGMPSSQQSQGLCQTYEGVGMYVPYNVDSLVSPSNFRMMPQQPLSQSGYTNGHSPSMNSVFFQGPYGGLESLANGYQNGHLAPQVPMGHVQGSTYTQPPASLARMGNFGEHKFLPQSQQLVGEAATAPNDHLNGFENPAWNTMSQNMFDDSVDGNQYSSGSRPYLQDVHPRLNDQHPGPGYLGSNAELLTMQHQPDQFQGNSTFGGESTVPAQDMSVNAWALELQPSIKEQTSSLAMQSPVFQLQSDGNISHSPATNGDGNTQGPIRRRSSLAISCSSAVGSLGIPGTPTKGLRLSQYLPPGTLHGHPHQCSPSPVGNLHNGSLAQTPGVRHPRHQHQPRMSSAVDSVPPPCGNLGRQTMSPPDPLQTGPGIQTGMDGVPLDAHSTQAFANFGQNNYQHQGMTGSYQQPSLPAQTMAVTTAGYPLSTPPPNTVCQANMYLRSEQRQEMYFGPGFSPNNTERITPSGSTAAMASRHTPTASRHTQAWSEHWDRTCRNFAEAIRLKNPQAYEYIMGTDSPKHQ